MRLGVRIPILLRSICLAAPLCGIGIAHGAAQVQTAPALDRGYRESFERWKADLVEDRRKNWLTLVGLFWLKPGENTFGSDAGNAVVLPLGRLRRTQEHSILRGRM